MEGYGYVRTDETDTRGISLCLEAITAGPGKSCTRGGAAHSRASCEAGEHFVGIQVEVARIVPFSVNEGLICIAPAFHASPALIQYNGLPEQPATSGSPLVIAPAKLAFELA
jgi:hypothetical protein